jgi:hypothetical protein
MTTRSPSTGKAGTAGAAAALKAAAALILLAAPAASLAQNYRATPIPPGEVPAILSGLDSGEDIDWHTIDGGGGRLSGGGPGGFTLDGTVGQPDVELVIQVGIIPGGGPLSIQGGFWSRYESWPPCYANCDNSTTHPVLNVADFSCFLQRFAAGDPYANCDNSTQPPVLNVADFTCYLQNFAAGCPF